MRTIAFGTLHLDEGAWRTVWSTLAAEREHQRELARSPDLSLGERARHGWRIEVLDAAILEIEAAIRAAAG